MFGSGWPSHRQMTVIVLPLPLSDAQMVTQSPDRLVRFEIEQGALRKVGELDLTTMTSAYLSTEVREQPTQAN